MKTIREFLEEQINEQLIQAVVSGRRTGEGPSKVKLRPVELKGKLCYQASVTEGTKVYHKKLFKGRDYRLSGAGNGRIPSASGNRTRSGWKHPHKQKRQGNDQKQKIIKLFRMKV